jgi:three-Cys-motif partner protein
MIKKDLKVASDGLPALPVGEWTIEKHERLRKYVGISSATRKKYATRSAAAYIDLYCSYGRSLVGASKLEKDGSSIVAAREANAKKSPFSEIHVADIEPDAVGATETRLKSHCASVHSYVGRAEVTVEAVKRKLNSNGLHFAFLDPYTIDLPFSIIQTLASFAHMDLLIHVSNFQRNLARYSKKDGGALDRFAPGWRLKVDPDHPNEGFVRSQIFDHWRTLIRGLDMQVFGVEKVLGNEGQKLYWLVFVARHELAGKFWKEICNVTGQGDLLG